MTTILIILVVIAVAVNIILAVFVLRKKPDMPKDDSGLKMVLDQMNTNMNELSRTVDRKVGDLTKTVDTNANGHVRELPPNSSNKHRGEVITPKRRELKGAFGYICRE
jgi:hypothetical protein